MSESTVHLGLPLIAAAQAQKHVTHNEALRLLDALVQLAVLDRDLAAPPASPQEGERWIVGPSPSGAWAGHAGHIAAWQDGAWAFSPPQPGWIAFVLDEAMLCVWNGTAWASLESLVTALQNLSRLGLGTTADAANPFAAKLNNALWSARYAGEGGDGNLRYKLNKEGAANTLSLLFQTDWSGRAELGLAGDDDFRLKVSADGTAWLDALRVDRTSGAVAIAAAAAAALAVGRQGATNPALRVNAQAASSVTGWEMVARAAGAGADLAVLSSAANESGSLSAKGTGTLTLQAAATGAIILNRPVGIGGTPTSTYRLHAKATAAGGALIGVDYVDDTTSFAEYRFLNGGSVKWAFGVGADSYAAANLQNAWYMYQYTNKTGGAVNAYRLVISDAGDVGVGNASPSRKLDVAGSFRATGDATLSSATASTSTTTGALVVTGGAGIGGGVNIGGQAGLGAALVSAAWLRLGAGTTARAQIRFEASTAPSAPADGDLWFDGTNFKARIGGVTRTFTLT